MSQSPPPFPSCPYCGAPLGPVEPRCPSCGGQNPYYESFAAYPPPNYQPQEDPLNPYAPPHTENFSQPMAGGSGAPQYPIYEPMWYYEVSKVWNRGNIAVNFIAAPLCVLPLFIGGCGVAMGAALRITDDNNVYYLVMFILMFGMLFTGGILNFWAMSHYGQIIAKMMGYDDKTLRMIRWTLGIGFAPIEKELIAMFRAAGYRAGQFWCNQKQFDFLKGTLPPSQGEDKQK